MEEEGKMSDGAGFIILSPIQVLRAWRKKCFTLSDSHSNDKSYTLWSMLSPIPSDKTNVFPHTSQFPWSEENLSDLHVFSKGLFCENTRLGSITLPCIFWKRYLFVYIILISPSVTQALPSALERSSIGGV